MQQTEPSRIKKLILMLKALELEMEVRVGLLYRLKDGIQLQYAYIQNGKWNDDPDDLYELLIIMDQMSWQEYVDLSLQIAEKSGEKNAD